MVVFFDLRSVLREYFNPSDIPSIGPSVPYYIIALAIVPIGNVK